MAFYELCSSETFIFCLILKKLALLLSLSLHLPLPLAPLPDCTCHISIVGTNELCLVAGNIDRKSNITQKPAGCPYLFALLSPHYLPLLPPPPLCPSLYTCIVSCQLESCDFPWSRLACLRFRACKVFKTIAEATRQHMSGGGAGETKLSMTLAENRTPNSIIHTHTHMYTQRCQRLQ